MIRFLLTLGVCLALLAVFTLPTAQATMNYDYATYDQLDPVATVARAGESRFADTDLDAKQGPQFEDVACRPLRGLLRGLRGIGRGVGRLVRGAGSC